MRPIIMQGRSSDETNIKVHIPEIMVRLNTDH